MSLNEFILLDLLDTYGIEGQLKINRIKDLYRQHYSRELVRHVSKSYIANILIHSAVLTVIKSPAKGGGFILTRKKVEATKTSLAWDESFLELGFILTREEAEATKTSAPWNESALLELLDCYGINGRLDLDILSSAYENHFNSSIPITGKLFDAVNLITERSLHIELVQENTCTFLRRRLVTSSTIGNIETTSLELKDDFIHDEQKKESFQRLENIKQIHDYIETIPRSIFIIILQTNTNNDETSFIEVGFQFDYILESRTLVYECPSSGIDDTGIIGHTLMEIFESGHKVYIHDAYGLKQYLKSQAIHHEELNIVDIQLAMEYIYDLPYNNTIEQVAEFLEVVYPKTIRECLNLITVTVDKMKDEIDWNKLNILYQASRNRLSNDCAVHAITFNKNKRYMISSKELLMLISPEDCYDIAIPTFYNDVDDLLNLLTSDVQQQILDLGVSNLTEICMDYGRPAYCWIGGKRYYLVKDTNNVRKVDTTPNIINKLSFGLFINNNIEEGETNDIIPQKLKDASVDVADEKFYVVTKADLDAVVSGVSTFGCDNRSGIEKKLHRISCMRNRDGTIIGLTLRVGRHIDGIASIVADLLFAHNKSILVLGEPGSGKTTVIRDMARLLSSKCNVVIVDTSNEIGGDGDIPHCCVGNARRMMVTKLPEQSNVMIECVQNHTPHAMIIDEIGRPQEVEAARTCKQRGVRMISSAHGNLKTLMKNPHLKGLIGGIEVVTVGDEAARRSSSGNLNKLKPQRQGEPVFDLIVELTRENAYKWTVISDTAKAVDSILEGKPLTVEIRSRDPLTNACSVQFQTLS